MKKILVYVKDYYKQQSTAYVLLIALFLTLLIYLNYVHHLEARFINVPGNWSRSFLNYYLLYSLVFIVPFLLQLFFYPGMRLWRSRWFGLILILAPVIFSFRVNFYYFYDEFKLLDEQPNSTVDLFVKTIITIIPIYFIWRQKDKSAMPFYGFKSLKQYKPYWIMLMIMVPLIAAASTQPDFLQKYPRAMILEGLPVDSPKEAVDLLLYELSYGLSFLSIEVFFRGFLVLALFKYCGTKSIIPIACFYVAIHFGKPMGEAISSFFGGVLLGIITYHTRSIWGGLIVHIGIAWLMEIGGYIGNSFSR